MASTGSGTNKKVFSVPLISIPLASIYNVGDSKPADDYNPDHSHPSWVKMCDLNKSGSCAMDGANHIPVYCDGNLPPGSNCPPAYPQYAYVQYVDVAPYFQIAAQYAYANRMFQNQPGSKFFPRIRFSSVAHPTGERPGTHMVCRRERVAQRKIAQRCPNGCIGATAQQKPPQGLTVQLIEPTPPYSESQTMFPCFNHTTLAEVLDGPKLPGRITRRDKDPCGPRQTRLRPFVCRTRRERNALDRIGRSIPERMASSMFLPPTC